MDPQDADLDIASLVGRGQRRYLARLVLPILGCLLAAAALVGAALIARHAVAGSQGEAGTAVRGPAGTSKLSIASTSQSAPTTPSNRQSAGPTTPSNGQSAGPTTPVLSSAVLSSAYSSIPAGSTTYYPATGPTVPETLPSTSDVADSESPGTPQDVQVAWGVDGGKKVIVLTWQPPDSGGPVSYYEILQNGKSIGTTKPSSKNVYVLSIPDGVNSYQVQADGPAGQTSSVASTFPSADKVESDSSATTTTSATNSLSGSTPATSLTSTPEPPPSTSTTSSGVPTPP